MKTIKLFFLALVLVCCASSYSDSFAQVKTRESSQAYVGVGYSFVIFTNSDMTDSYPLFGSSGDFLKEVNFFGGIRVSRSLALELSPSIMFSNTSNSKGFYYGNPSVAGRDSFYVPNTTSFLSLPINLKVKYYPFTKDMISQISNFYVGFEAGMVYVKEEFNNYVYTDNTMSRFARSQTDKNSFWKPDFGISIGFGSTAKFGYGFEASYRFISLEGDRKYPLTTSLAKDMNSVNLTAKLIFSFN
ncbi:MAG: hypothetical protein KBG21_05870 [Ignavibacteria bacterium]|nr:hypothetical protein [Ignavibacteria bacterium]